ncbi:MAG: hypothetical protein QOJ84_1092 [Bradyrhizobium sp.]|jgi:hypothetical protein|nr:hypothetical protein [Bradyrhizobium sp.]
MPLFSEHHDQLDARLLDAPAVTGDLMSEIVGGTCRRFPSRIEGLIQSGAWTDAALALLELELPRWRLRRLAWDEGEWHCALSRQRELPDWLDQSAESHHAELPLAILRAFIDARRQLAPSSSVPAVPSSVSPLYEPVCCDNFA